MTVTRPARPEDGPGLARLDRDNAHYPWPEKHYLRLCDGVDSNRWALVAHAADSELRGFVVCDQVVSEGSILNLIVARACRGCGIGRQLMIEALRRMGSSGVKHCYLEVRASNEVAGALYKSLGFAEIGLRRGYYRDGKVREDARVLSLQLGPAQ